MIWPFYHPADGRECKKCPWCILLPTISKLLLLSNHLALLKPNPQADENRQRLDESIYRAAVAGESREVLQETLANTSNVAHCGKMKALRMLLEEFKSQGSKVLLFSLSTKMLDILESLVTVQGYIFLRLDGTTAQVILIPSRLCIQRSLSPKDTSRADMPPQLAKIALGNLFYTRFATVATQCGVVDGCRVC